MFVKKTALYRSLLAGTIGALLVGTMAGAASAQPNPTLTFSRARVLSSPGCKHVRLPDELHGACRERGFILCSMRLALDATPQEK